MNPSADRLIGRWGERLSSPRACDLSPPLLTAFGELLVRDFVVLQNFPQTIHLAAGRNNKDDGLPTLHPNAKIFNQLFDPALILGRRLSKDRVIGPLVIGDW